MTSNKHSKDQMWRNDEGITYDWLIPEIYQFMKRIEIIKWHPQPDHPDPRLAAKHYELWIWKKGIKNAKGPKDKGTYPDGIFCYKSTNSPARRWARFQMQPETFRENRTYRNPKTRENPYGVDVNPLNAIPRDRHSIKIHTPAPIEPLGANFQSFREAAMYVHNINISNKPGDSGINWYEYDLRNRPVKPEEDAELYEGGPAEIKDPDWDSYFANYFANK